MQQGGAERELSPSGGESLLDDPFAILERLEALRHLEESIRNKSFSRFARAVGMTHEEEAVILMTQRDQRDAVRANFVQWLSDGWREVNEKISTVPLGEARRVPNFSAYGPISSGEREVVFNETTSIKEEVMGGRMRVFTLHHSPDGSRWINVDFTVLGNSDLFRVEIKAGSVPEKPEASGYVALSGRNVEVRWEQVSQFSFELPAAHPAAAAS